MLNVVMLNVIILSVVAPYFGRHNIEPNGTQYDGFKCVSLSVVMLTSVILIVAKLSVVILSVVILSIVNCCGGEFTMLNVVMLCEYRYAECLSTYFFSLTYIFQGFKQTSLISEMH